MKHKLLKLSNDFHRTRATIHAHATERAGEYLITRRQTQRAQRALCGMSDCKCGGYFGERAGDYLIVTETYSRDLIVQIY